MNRSRILSNFWKDRLEVNSQRAIFHQWEQLEASGCIENFRIAAGLKEGFREGWFFADSDAFKWLEAASRILAYDLNPKLASLIDEFIDLISRAQSTDGYIFTYNQIHFPGVRWRNLQIEHELYCHGHLIEAGVSHHEVTGRTDLLEIARKAADRIVEDFKDTPATFTPGHEEIEIALMRLHQLSPGNGRYLELARQFIEQRGRAPFYGLLLLRQSTDSDRRTSYVKQKKQEYIAAHPEFKPFKLPPGNVSKKPRGVLARWYTSALTGKYFQQHSPIRRQTVPVGHSVRFAYLGTAAAILARLSGDCSLLPTLQHAWERMVTRRMYVTGGIGSLPGLEGFGNDYELDPEFAYAETCAALASLYWNWEMTQLTGEPKYSDLFEWQLYNAAAVGMGIDGTTYLYNNPMTCRGGVLRRPWYAVPCCPSNLSRTWAYLDRYIYSAGQGSLSVHQYISSKLENEIISFPNGSAVNVSLEMKSGFPWDGKVHIFMEDVSTKENDQPASFELQLRIPSWAGSMNIKINGQPGAVVERSNSMAEKTASGFDPRSSIHYAYSRFWQPGDVVAILFDMPIRLLRAHPKVRGHTNKVAVTRGPLVYCLESIDQPELDIFDVQLDAASLTSTIDADDMAGAVKIQGQTKDGAPLTFIPYLLWGNRGPSKMTIWTKT